MHEALQVLLADGVIEEVVARLKSGKEADVYIVSHGGQYVAAKIYKERTQRNFKNNAGYKEGRLVRNSRTRRAMEKGSRFGQEASEEEWKATESEALSKLFAASVRVPAPVMFYEGVLLMELVVDPEGQPAPRLVDALLDAHTAGEFYRDLRQQAVKMLCCDIIHGDLSAYNILLGAQGPTVIDFPQIVSAAANSRAEFFFKRDVDNLRQFFAGYDARLLDRAGDAAEIWRAYVKRELTPDFEPSGRFVRDARGPRGGTRHGQRPQRDGGRPFPPREHRYEPAPAAPEVEDEFALLRQGGGERPKMAQLARNGHGRDRGHRGGGHSGHPSGGSRHGAPQGGRPHGGGGQGRPPRAHEPRPPPGSQAQGPSAPRSMEARGPQGGAHPHGQGRPPSEHGSGRPPHGGGQGPRGERPSGARPQRPGGQGRRGGAPVVSYVSRAAGAASGTSPRNSRGNGGRGPEGT